MTTLREAAQQALETLEALSAAENIIWVQKRAEIEVEHLRAALAQEEQTDINWLKARPHIEQFIAGLGFDMTITNERLLVEIREKVDVRNPLIDPSGSLGEPIV